MFKTEFKLKTFRRYTLFFALTAAFFTSFAVFAEPSVGVFKLEPKNIDNRTNTVINNAIFNFIKEQKKYEIIDMRGNTSEEGRRLDFVFTGTLTGLENGIELKLILKIPARLRNSPTKPIVSGRPIEPSSTTQKQNA